MSPPQEVLDGQPHPPPPTCTGAGGQEEAHESVFVPIPLEATQDVPEDEGNSTGDVSEEENTSGEEMPRGGPTMKNSSSPSTPPLNA